MELIKASIFLEAVLAIEIILEPQSNLEEKVNYFSSEVQTSSEGNSSYCHRSDA